MHTIAGAVFGFDLLFVLQNLVYFYFTPVPGLSIIAFRYYVVL
jgi:hypothetical protein